MTKFPHIFRNISRTSLMVRFAVILLVIGILLCVLIASSRQNLSDGNAILGKQLKNDQGSPNAHLQMALFWEKKFLQTNDKADFEQAKQEVQIAQQLDPTNIFGLKLARRLEQEDLIEAQTQIAETKKILEQRPDYLEAWQRLAILYEQIGEKTLAQEAREKAEQLNSLGL